ncbi:MAG: cytochrome c [Xanthobacteraceae bacterium]|nr:cytochrome c [Xanthobacteraceae bacterium]
MRAIAALLLGASLVGGAGGADAGESVEYLYRLHCSGCHGVEGAGSLVGRIPPFVGIVGHFAGTEEGRLYLVRVPGVANAALSDDDTARLLNYVLHTWGSAELPADARDFTAAEVGKSRETHVDDISRLRAKLGAELAKHGKSIAY